MLGFSDSRKPNVIIASVGSFVLFIGSIIGGAFFLESEWSTNAIFSLVAKVMFAAINVFAIVMSLYAIVTVYSNGWLFTTRLGRPVLGIAPWVLYFWLWKLFILIKEVL